MSVNKSRFSTDESWLDLFVQASDETYRSAEPLTCGIPWPQSLLPAISYLRMHDEQERLIPLQSRPLDLWPDGSPRWVLLDWQAQVKNSTIHRLSWSNDQDPTAPPEQSISLSKEENVHTVKTGAAAFQMRVGAHFPLECVQQVGERNSAPWHVSMRIEDDKRRIFEPMTNRIEVEEIGALRSVVRASGHMVCPGHEPIVEFVTRFHFFAGSATVRLHLTYRNPRKADHPGGMWDLGSKGSVYIRDAAFSVSIAGHAGDCVLRCSPETKMPFETMPLPLELYQDSSGGENWRSHNHFNRYHVVPNTFRGYRLRDGQRDRYGLRATPIVALNRGEASLAIAISHFWQNFPKAVEAAADSLTLRLFPRQYADLHELQGGEQKTHVVFVSFGQDKVTRDPLAWCRSPSLPHADPAWYCAASATPYLIPRSEDPHTGYIHLVDAAVEGDDTFEHKREVIDEYSWRHFGDVYGDHEAVFHKGPEPLVSHYNNQFDVLAGFAVQFLRSADVRWWQAMNELAWHVRDIDIYHNDQDKSLYNGGLFWPTFHYFDADIATHRSYPSRYAGPVDGGGPANEHNYTTGLMLHYFLTGDETSRETVIDLARWVINIEDGNKTVFRWLDRSDTGYSSSTRSPNYHGPGRGSANSLAALVDGHRLTGDHAFLDQAAKLIARVIHPGDNLFARNLLDAETRWSYTMFLQSLGKWLDYKANLGQLDFMYGYARASLLHYASWMAQHEYPYLDKPEILEYPTETWAAQDMRKSEVFKFAVLHAAGEARIRFLERAEFFFRESTTRLSGMKTRTLCRPVVLMLNNGFMHAWLKRHPDASAPPPIGVHEFGQPQVFVPQRQRAKRRLVLLAASLCALFLLVLIVAFFHFFK